MEAVARRQHRKPAAPSRHTGQGRRGAVLKILPYAVFGAATLAVLLPLLRPGYILTLDMVFTPHLRMPEDVNYIYPFYALLHYANLLFPSAFIQKLLLCSIFFLAGLGAYRLTAKKAPYGAYFAGLLYLINPFTYERLMAGQYLVLFGYALLPWFLRALLVFLEGPTVKSALRVAGWAVGISFVSVHSMGFTLLFGVLFGTAAMWRRRSEKTYVKRVALFTMLAAGIVIVANSFWLFPAVTGKGETAQAIQHFNATRRQAFATVDGGVSRPLNVMRLEGFWLEARDMFLLPADLVPGWGWFIVLLWMLVGAGMVHVWHSDDRWLLVCFGLSGLIATILASGILQDWLAAQVPFFAGYREPQKFVAVLALCYAFFGAHGVEYLARLIWQKARLAVALAAMAVPLVITFVLLWGANGQLQPVQYPADWFAMNQRLNQDTGGGNVLFLPWYLYMSFGFSQRVIANPADKFFDKPVISSDDPELPGVRPEIPDTTKALLSSRILPQAARGKQLGARLAPLHIKYVLLAKEQDYQRYNYLYGQNDVRQVAQNAHLVLFLNTEYRP
ncbi:MAG TPA: hypothetical protein VKQ34_00560 [Candidatus Saccharimonadales bacterium]|nr:hypothetical protein [Candidatus Saccharimonadales bacterium]